MKKLKKEKDKYILICGDLVKSLKGRDSGYYFVVTKIIDNDFVEICDGKFRKLKNPKKKRNKHLKKIQHFEIIHKKSKENKKIFDSEINGLIKKYYEKEGDSCQKTTTLKQKV